MKNKTRVLIVDDDKRIAELLSLYLNKEGYETREVYNGTEAASAFLEFEPALVLLDVMLPGMDGYGVLSELRKAGKAAVIMLTAKGDTFDKVLGLELGADDYVTKPFEPKELMARVKAVLRRGRDDNGSGGVEFDGLSINPTTHTVIYHGEKLDMPPKEFELLLFLASKPNQVFTREQLLDRVWGYDFMGDTRTVDVHVKRLREKMSKGDMFCIKTVWSVGYKFDDGRMQ